MRRCIEGAAALAESALMAIRLNWKSKSKRILIHFTELPTGARYYFETPRHCV